MKKIKRRNGAVDVDDDYILQNGEGYVSRFDDGQRRMITDSRGNPAVADRDFCTRQQRGDAVLETAHRQYRDDTNAGSDRWSSRRQSLPSQIADNQQTTVDDGLRNIATDIENRWRR